MLTSEEILFILKAIGQQIVVAPTKDFPFTVSCEGRGGYSDDKNIGKLQAKLSIMLEVACVREGAK